MRTCKAPCKVSFRVLCADAASAPSSATGMAAPFICLEIICSEIVIRTVRLLNTCVDIFASLPAMRTSLSAAERNGSPTQAPAAHAPSILNASRLGIFLLVGTIWYRVDFALQEIFEPTKNGRLTLQVKRPRR